MAMSSTDRSRKKRALDKARKDAAAAMAAQQEETKHGALLAEITLLRQEILALGERLATRDDLRRFAAGQSSPPPESQNEEPFHRETEPELVGSFLIDPLFVTEPKSARRCAEELIGIARLGDQAQVVFPLVDPSQIGLAKEGPTGSGPYLRPFLIGQAGVWFLSDEGPGVETQALYVLTGTPFEALALRAVAGLGKGTLPSLEEAFDISEFVYVATGSGPDEIAGVVARAKQRNAYIGTAYASDPAGRATAARVVEEATRREVPRIEPLTNVLALAGPQVTDFVQLWQLLLQQGADVVAERILAGRKA